MQRREFLRSGTLAAFSLALDASRPVFSRPRFRDDPFRLGVASGEPTEGSVVLWTRLAPSPMEPNGGMEPAAFRVRWQVADDEAMRRIVREGEALALPELAHSVHVDVGGLEPSREYWYRFMAGNEESVVARTKTLPPARGPVGGLTFATASCQHYEPGYYVAYEHMVRDAPDFVLHLGDYIYDVSFGDDFRKHETEETPRTLEAYRLRHALYKGDEFLRKAHANLPFLTVPDNHDALEFHDPSELRRRAAAYQAWYEHLPIRATYRRGSASLAIYRSMDIGELARLYVLDTRQFRDDQLVCAEGADPAFGFGIYHPRCGSIEAEARSMLGREGESWLEDRMRTSRATWNVVATTVPFAPFEFHRDGDRYVYYGAWSAYPKNRDRVLATVTNLALPNPVFVSGDLHSSWVSEIEVGDEVVATEFTTTSISAGWPPTLSDPVSENLKHNPHVKLYEGVRRGYCLHTIDGRRWTTRMRLLDSITRKDAGASELGPFTIEAGRAGVLGV